MKIVFYTPAEVGELKQIKDTADRHTRKSLIEAFCARTDRSFENVQQKIYGLKKKESGNTPRVKPSAQWGPKTSPSSGTIQVSKSRIDIAVKNLEITQAEDGKMWLRINY